MIKSRIENQSDVETIVHPDDDDTPSIETLLEELRTERDGTARAELAGDLVKETSLLMDTEDTVLVALFEERQLDRHAVRLHDSIERVRTSMEPVYAATHNSAPIEVHQSDSEAFERILTSFESAVQAHLTVERTELAELQAQLTTAERSELVAQLEAAWSSAIPKPHPPSGGMARRWAHLLAHLDRPDSATEYRPARARREARAEGRAGSTERHP